MNKNELSLVKLSLILLLIASLSGLILSLVYSFTNPKILENAKKEEIKSLKIIMPELKSFTFKKDYYLIYSDNEKKHLIGYIFKTSGKGYGGKVYCNVGINLEGKITGIVVTAHTETPGLGSKITEVKKGEQEPFHLKQYKGKTQNEMNLDVIQAITGATISTKAVLTCAKQAFEKFNELTK